jgi:hypothetical protein
MSPDTATVLADVPACPINPKLQAPIWVCCLLPIYTPFHSWSAPATQGFRRVRSKVPHFQSAQRVTEIVHHGCWVSPAAAIFQVRARSAPKRRELVGCFLRRVILQWNMRAH